MRLIQILLLLSSLQSLAASNATLPSLVVTASTDSSGMGLEKTIQFALAKQYDELKLFSVKMSGFTFAGFTERDIGRAFESLNSKYASFAYLEKERVAIFLFDASRPKEFIAVSEALVNPSAKTRAVSRDRVEDRLGLAFKRLMAQLKAGAFEPLPGAHLDTQAMELAELEENQRKSLEARTLFRELASIQEGRFYVGANVGMARISANSSSVSTINLGGLIGSNFYDNFRAEVGFNCFSYALAFVDLKYLLPLHEKYISVGLSVGGGRILGIVSQSDGFDPSNLPDGQMLAGPGFSVLVPLIGAHIRGEVKLYAGKGGGSVVMGTYGVTFSL